jgi:hypothetical protein
MRELSTKISHFHYAVISLCLSFFFNLVLWATLQTSETVRSNDSFVEIFVAAFIVGISITMILSILTWNKLIALLDPVIENLKLPWISFCAIIPPVIFFVPCFFCYQIWWLTTEESPETNRILIPIGCALFYIGCFTSELFDSILPNIILIAAGFLLIVIHAYSLIADSRNKVLCYRRDEYQKTTNQ